MLKLVHSAAATHAETTPEEKPKPRRKAPKKRRGRKHPGVVLIKPDASSGNGWRARYKDPDSGQVKKERLDPSLSTAELREDWAVNKSRQLAKRRMELEAGAERVAGLALTDAIAAYHRTAEDRLRRRTRDTYKVATDLLLEWAKSRGIVSTTQLTATKLPGFRDFLLSQRKQAYVKGGTRGARKAGTEKLHPLTANWKLRAVKTVLNHLRLRGQVPLSSDAISDALKPVTVPREDPDFLTREQCARLLEAALAHDAACFAETRSEHSGKGEKGRTPRYDPIAPFVAFCLLTGMRFGEALGVRWDAVDLTTVDPDGCTVGEIKLRASETKTGHARTVSLDVSPSLLLMLAAMKLRAGRDEYVFGGRSAMSRTLAEASRRRLVGAKYNAPAGFSWQVLRSTCATYQCNGPSLFGAAAHFLSARRLGHSVTVSEKHYAGRLAVSRDARTLESAMGIVEPMVRVVAGVVRGR